MGSSDYSGGESDSGGSSYSYGSKKGKKDKKEKKDKDKKDKGKDKEKDKDKDKKDKDKKDKKEKDHKDKDDKDKKGKDHKDKDDKDKKEHKDKDKDKKDKDKDKKDKDKHKDDKPSTSYGLPAAPSFPAVAGSSGHGAPSIPKFPSPQGYHHNPALGVSHPSPLPPPSGPAPTVIPNTMSFDGPPSSGYRVPLDPSKPFPSHNFQETGPPVTYDLDGSPIFIGSVLLDNAVHPCKIGPHLKPPAQVAYGGGEIGHNGRYDLLPFVPDQMEWVRTSHGRIPHGKRPVEGGYEEGGEKLYHALAVVDNVKVPGKTGEHLGGANVGFGGVERAVQEGYEILCWKY
ncbi:hypothetical protein H1R20_g14678, partial [Candolleomyces eurysporus]